MQNGLTQTAGARFSYKMSQIHTTKDLPRVTVHSTRTLPLVDEQGLDVETNQATNIAFHSINYERQKHPYGTCISSWNETELGSMVTSEHGELPYTQGVDLYSLSTKLISIFQQCTRFCFFKAFADSCGCFHPQLLDQNPEADKLNVSRACNLTSSGGEES